MNSGLAVRLKNSTEHVLRDTLPIDSVAVCSLIHSVQHENDEK